MPLDGGSINYPNGYSVSMLRIDGQVSWPNSVVARQLQESSEAVVILGIGGSYMGAKAILDGCCEPYYNELSKEQRAGRPPFILKEIV